MTGDGELTGDQRLEITGYGFRGQVTIRSTDPGHVTVTAELMPQDE